MQTRAAIIAIIGVLALGGLIYFAGNSAPDSATEAAAVSALSRAALATTSQATPFVSPQ